MLDTTCKWTRLLWKVVARNMINAVDGNKHAAAHNITTKKLECRILHKTNCTGPTQSGKLGLSQSKLD